MTFWMNPLLVTTSSDGCFQSGEAPATGSVLVQERDWTIEKGSDTSSDAGSVGRHDAPRSRFRIRIATGLKKSWSSPSKGMN